MRFLPRVLVVCLLLVPITGCSEDPDTPIVSKIPKAPQRDYDKELTRLLEASRAAEPEIAALRKSHFEISESLALPAAKDRQGAVDWKARTRSFRQPEVALYEQRSQDPPEAKALATKFLKLCIEASVLGNAPAKELEALASAVITTGSKDPMIEAYAYLMRPFPEDVKLIAELQVQTQKLAEGLSEEDRGLNYEVQIRRFLLQLDTLNREGFAKTDLMTQADHMRQFTESMLRFIERVSEPEHYCSAWLHFEYYTRILMEGQKQAICRRIVQSEKTADWYKALAAAQILTDEGWDARGEGTSDQVSEDGWNVLRKKQAEARSLALLAWKIRPETPQPATLMEYLVGSGAEDEWGLRQWFQVAVHARFDHEESYTRFRHFMQPQWGGSDRELLSFARECIETARLDTRVPQMGLSLLWDLNIKNGMKGTIMRTEDTRAAVSLYAEKVLLAIEKGEYLWTNVSVWQESILQWLVESGNYPLAQKWLASMKEPFEEQAVAEAGGSLNRCKQVIAACTGPASEAAVPLVARIYGTKPIEPEELPALRAQLASLKSKDTSELTAALCHEIEIVFGQLESFETGAWTSLKFSPEMSGWQRIVAENWSAVDEQTLTMQSSGTSYVYPVARFEPPYMVDVEVQLLDPEGKTPNSPAFVFTGFEWAADPWQAESAYVGVNPGLNDAYARIGPNIRGYLYPPANSRHVRIKVWPEEVESTIDGSITNQGPTMGRFMTRIALGADPLKNEPTAYRFHNLRIRKLPYEPVIPVPAEDMDTYGQKVIDFDPSEPEGYIYQYQGHMSENQILKAIQTLETGVQKVARSGDMYAYLTDLYFRTGRYQDAWKACQLAPKYSNADFTVAYKVMLLACSEDPAIRNPQAALQAVPSANPDRIWRGALAQALAEAANGNMVAAKASLEGAAALAQDSLGRKEVAKYLAIIQRGEVPVLKEGDTSPPEAPTETPAEAPVETAPATP